MTSRFRLQLCRWSVPEPPVSSDAVVGKQTAHVAVITAKPTAKRKVKIFKGQLMRVVFVIHP